jgi:hypothetical protein
VLLAGCAANMALALVFQGSVRARKKPERVNVQTVEVKVDADLIEQLRLRAASLQGGPH